MATYISVNRERKSWTVNALTLGYSGPQDVNGFTLDCEISVTAEEPETTAIQNKLLSVADQISQKTEKLIGVNIVVELWQIYIDRYNVTLRLSPEDLVDHLRDLASREPDEHGCTRWEGRRDAHPVAQAMQDITEDNRENSPQCDRRMEFDVTLGHEKGLGRWHGYDKPDPDNPKAIPQDVYDENAKRAADLAESRRKVGKTEMAEKLKAERIRERDAQREERERLLAESNLKAVQERTRAREAALAMQRQITEMKLAAREQARKDKLELERLRLEARQNRQTQQAAQAAQAKSTQPTPPEARTGINVGERVERRAPQGGLDSVFRLNLDELRAVRALLDTLITTREKEREM
jgi:hypothetical protein